MQEDHKDLHNPRMLIEANAARVIKAITKTPLEIPEDAEVIDMCKAVEDMIKDSKAEGKMEGHAEGKAEGVLDTLIGLVKDDLLSVKEATKRANMTESEFEEKNQKALLNSKLDYVIEKQKSLSGLKAHAWLKIWKDFLFYDFS